MEHVYNLESKVAAKRTRDTWFLVAVVSPIILLGVWMIWPDNRQPTPVWPSSSDAGGQPPTTVASQWERSEARPVTQVQSADGGEVDQTESESDIEASLDRLQHTLANIGIDENGDLILDEIALVSLRQAFRELEDTSPEALAELQLYVQAGLAGETGEQAATILGDYVHFRRALEQAENEWMNNGDLSPRQKLDQIIALRREHMGPLTASQLFAGEDAHERYLIAMEEVRSDPGLNVDERQAALSQLRDDLRSGALLVNSEGTSAIEELRAERESWQQLGLSDETRNYLEQQTLGLVAARELAGSETGDWEARYGRFEQERDTVIRAGLGEEEKRRQINELVNQHFSAEEQNAAENWLPRHLRTEVDQ